MFVHLGRGRGGELEARGRRRSVQGRRGPNLESSWKGGYCRGIVEAGGLGECGMIAAGYTYFLLLAKLLKFPAHGELFLLFASTLREMIGGRVIWNGVNGVRPSPVKTNNI